MTDPHPITPPPELLKQWEDDWHEEREHADVLLVNAYAAGALAGADAELEACCAWFTSKFGAEVTADIADLRAARRPKPLSLKEQALALVSLIQGDEKGWQLDDLDVVRRALEQLDD
jgi:hypothetical protein